MAALPSMACTVKLNIGIGAYSYHNLSMEEMIVQLNALGIRDIEMSRGELMLMNHPDEGMLPLRQSQVRPGRNSLRFLLPSHH